ncbi:MAG: DUF167 domain-containing protein [Caulobacteraceae bacterium]|nr:DUF167 domain-containing protein [Caulobacteraceae bacterium]
MRLTVRVTPRGGRDAVEGWAKDAAGRAFLKLRVAAPPADGAANAAAVALLAKALKRPKSRIAIVSGETARLKTVEIGEVSPEELTAAFGAAP